jgi:hypothetical protein
MSNSFQIILTRKNLDCAHDDEINVKVNSYDEFAVRYTDKDSGKSRFDMTFDWDELLEYFDSLKHMLSLDIAPFADVQIQVPGFPVIALTPYLFAQNETHEIFVDIVERYVNQLSIKPKYVAPEDEYDCCPCRGY